MTNPLVAAYRKPALYVSLPSGGKYYTDKPKLSVDGELAVYAMTARDELLYKTPDALFNGEATFAVLRSCCPDVIDPEQMPVNDLLVVLLGIRQATHGSELSVDIKCPACQELNMLAVDSNRLLSTVSQNQVSDKLVLENNFTIHVKPYSLRDRTLLQIQQVKQQKMIQSLTASDLTEEQRSEQFGKTFIELANLTVDLISNCIYAVRPPEGEEITDQVIIKEWLQSITKDDYDMLRSTVDAVSDDCIDTNLTANCQHCSHEWKTKIDLDVANFFAG